MYRIEAMEDRRNMTDLIRQAQSGDILAADELLTITYGELHQLAHARLRTGGRNVMLDTTSLVNEWYLRFVRSQGAELQDRVHFMRYAARVMRSVIVDFVRRLNAARRGGGAAPESLLHVQLADGDPAEEDQILRVHESLEELAKLDSRMAQIVEMRFFAGMTEREIAEAFGLSTRTVRREWEKARLWLAESLK